VLCPEVLGLAVAVTFVALHRQLKILQLGDRWLAAEVVVVGRRRMPGGQTLQALPQIH
jgi:hypothetical protein